MEGFFDAIPLPTSKVESFVPRCGLCGLHKRCNTPKMPITGDGKLGILIVAEAPGAEEDERGVQLVGAAGQVLRGTLSRLGVDLDRDCWKTNAIICRPKDNRTPSNDEVDYCRPNLAAAIRDLQPRVIVPLGGVAVRSVLGPLFREDTGPIGKWVGWQIPCQRHNAWIIPNYHPSYVLHTKDSREGPVVRLWFDRHIESAVRAEGRPWSTVPDWANDVRVLYDPEAVAQQLDAWVADGGAVAFDYETDRLKPDSGDASVVCCAVCWRGKVTIAYPWVGQAVRATQRLLAASNPKIGANNKFEERWTRRALGVEVNNWAWDGMLSAHHLDCRDGITSVKFQAFVRLGMEPWDEHVKPYLRAERGNDQNRIRQLDLRSLLVYCGLDAFCEFKVAEAQRREMRCEEHARVS